MISQSSSYTLRSVMLAVGTAIFCLAIVFVSLHALYPSTGASVKFLAYVLVFNLFPGLVLCRLFLPNATEAGVYFAFSLGVGIVANVLTLTLLWPFGRLSLLFLLPIVAGGIAIVRSYRSDSVKPLKWTETQNGWSWICSVIFICSVALIGLGYLYNNANPDSYSWHTAFEAVIIRGLEVGWPPPNFLFPNAPWSYNYAAHLWLLGVHVLTGLPVDSLIVAYGPALLGGASAVLMAAFGRSVVGLRWWISYAAVFAVFGVVGIPPISGAVFASFMPYGANLILSPFLAIIVFFLMLAFVLEKRTGTIGGTGFRISVLIVLAFLATGARGVCPPIVLCALALRLTISAWRREGSLLADALDILAVIVGFAAGMQFFFTAADGFSGAGTVKVTFQPFSFLASQDLLTLPRMLINLGIPRIPAGMIGFSVIAIFQAGFLTPALPACFMQMRKHARAVDIVLLGCGIAGLSGFFLTRAPEFSHISFLYFSNISFALLGARGLQLMLLGARSGFLQHRHLAVGAYAAVVILGALHLAQVPIKTLEWAGKRWSASVVEIAAGASEQLPHLSSCMREDDADLFARAGQISPSAIVIPVYSGNHCASTWWAARHPIRTLNPYVMQHVPGSATDPVLFRKIETQRQHTFHAAEAASKGVLDVADVVAIAMTLIDKGPVFVMAPRALSVEPTDRLQLIGSSEAFSLWQVSVP